MKGLSDDLLNTQNTLVFAKKTFLDSTLTASNELIGIIRQWNTNDVDLIWWFVNESNEHERTWSTIIGCPSERTRLTMS